MGAPIEYDRWYFLDVQPTRAQALAEAKKRRKSDEPGLWVYRIRHGRNGGYTIEKARRMSDTDMNRTRYFNRRIREESSGQRKMF